MHEPFITRVRTADSRPIPHVACVAVIAIMMVTIAGCSSGSSPEQGTKTNSDGCTAYARDRSVPPVGRTPLDRWLAHRPLYVAHRGGDANWVEGTASAYRAAAAWSPRLALEVPVWRSSDGVWVVSEDATTGRVFGTNDSIQSSAWSTLSALRTTVGGHRMARLVDDVLKPYGMSRILFIDNKAAKHVDEFFDLLDSYAGNTRYVSKSYYTAKNSALEAHKRGYVTWGYYYDRNMTAFAATQSRFDLLGLNYSAPAADFLIMRATGKAVIAHVITTPSSASTGSCKGASGYMVSDVKQVVPN